MAENFVKKSQNRSLNKNILYKNAYFNHYDYFSQIKIKFNDFKNFIKITNINFRIKNESFHLHTKPYNILNNNSYSSVKSNPYLLVIHNMYRQHLRLDNYFFKTSRIVKNKIFENLFIFFSFQKKLFTHYNLIKN